MEKLRSYKKSKPNFIQISPDGISYGFHTHSIKEKNGMYSWYIPSFELYFSSQNKEQGEKRAIEIAQSFFNYWLKEKGERAFLMRIIKLGYKTKSHEETRALLSRTNSNARLNALNKKLPDAFKQAEEKIIEGNFETSF